MLLYISLVGSANVVKWLPSAAASGNADYCLTLDAVTQIDDCFNWTSFEAHLRKFVGVNNHGSMIRWSLQISGRMKKWLDVLMRFIKPLVQTRALDAGRLEEIWKFFHMQRQQTGNEMFYKLQLKFMTWGLCRDGSYGLLQDACILWRSSQGFIEEDDVWVETELE